MSAQAAKQAQFEQDVLRSYIGGGQTQIFLLNIFLNIEFIFAQPVPAPARP